jgi:endonuclease YncB( thermonuclease family)
VVGAEADKGPGDVALPAVTSVPAAPQVVIQGGEIPKDWAPKPIPCSAIGPDGRPITVHVAPTYTFTYAIGPPVPIAAQPPPVRAVAARPVTVAAAQRPSVPYGTPWVFQTQGLQPVDPGIVVAKPYQLPDPPSRWVAAPFPDSPPAGPNMPSPIADAPPQIAGGPLQPPPTQWIPAASPPPAPGTEAIASVAPAAIAGAAAAAAPQPIPTSPASGATTAQSASLSPSSAPQSPPLAPVSEDSRSLSNVHTWRVVGVHDGDTVTCIDDTNTKQKVRLAEIDAPEIGQDFGKVSRDALAELVFGKTVEVRDDGKDRYGRWIGHLSVDGVDVNRQMVGTGNAWHYAAYSQDEQLDDLEQQARARKLGLWTQPSPTPPWEFRKNGGRPNATTRLDRRISLRHA